MKTSGGVAACQHNYVVQKNKVYGITIARSDGQRSRVRKSHLRTLKKG
jgi:hypothetical protein